VWVPPPAPELEDILSLFRQKKLDLWFCGWGLKFERQFTGKTVSETTHWGLQLRTGVD
jgi:hypothetical protein